MSESVRELEGKVALGTGATRGIGRGIADELARAGARVAVVGRGEESAAKVAAGLPGDGHRGYGCDVADGEAVDALIASVEKDMGGLDVLVNNAGVTADNLLMRMKDDEWERVLAVNLRGAFHTIRAASKGMMRRRAGR
ncbi:MAG TPA: SDR family NAD(P)-dependent oxidoreductase, partial [Longimicrobiales bacterium]|nr:SDR family NAD(P)-dependent oxidoreductase [Longimicrobiales bacterium]